MPLIGGGFTFRLPTSMKIGQMLDKASSRLKASQAKLTKAKKEVAAHKDMMKRARFTPQGYKKATAKLHALQKLVATLEKQVAKDRKLAMSIA